MARTKDSGHAGCLDVSDPSRRQVTGVVRSDSFRVLMTREEIDKDRERWLALRMQGAGASETAVVLNQDPYLDVRTLALVKAGRQSGENIDDISPAWWGRHLEDPILSGMARLPERLRYKKRTSKGEELEAVVDYSPIQGMRCEPWGDLLQSTANPRVLATPDAWQTRPNRTGPGVLQVKHSGLHPFLIERGTLVMRQPYEPYLIQVQAELAVTGLQWGTLAMLCCGVLLYWDVERDETLIDEIFEMVERFWRQVERRREGKAA
jgi:hypothetical protein